MKLLVPTRTGIDCFKSEGANMGSGTTKSSTTTKAIAKMTERMAEVATKGSDHYERMGKERGREVRSREGMGGGYVRGGLRCTWR